MDGKFIKNEQFNFIKKQVTYIKNSQKQNIPKDVLTAVIDVANAKILERFPNASVEQQNMLDLSKLKTDQEYEQYIEHLSAYLRPLPTITSEQLKKMFPKHKKLKLPDLSNIDHDQLTYLSWIDSRSNKKFIIYELEGKMVGIECEFAPTSKKNICSFCNSVSEVTYFSTVTKAKKVNNPDYYRSIANFICIDSKECNKNITDVEYLETFLKDSLGI